MDLFYNLYMNILKSQSGGMGLQWRDRNIKDFIKNILICVLKMKALQV